MSNLNPRQFFNAHNMTVRPYLGTYDDMMASEEAVHRVASRVDPGILHGLTIDVTRYTKTRLAGEYEHAENTARIHPDVIEHPQGLMHELGHRHSALMGNHHAAYDTPERRQAEEDYAIRYADRHRP